LTRSGDEPWQVRDDVADEVRIDVTCQGCGAARRPIVSCHACGRAGDREADGREWRALVSEIHHARMADVPAPPRRDRIAISPGPVRATVDLSEPVAVPASIVPADDSLDPGNGRSFDWNERRRLPRLHRAA
jgi:hypothetical protein